MDFAFDESQKLLRDEITRFAREQLSPGAAGRDADQKFDRELWTKCASMGLLSLPVPEEHGGAGLDPLSTAIALEALGYGCRDGGLTFSVCAHLLSCVVPVWKFGDEAQRAEYLPGLCDGSLICANGMTEPDSGSDAFALRTRAEEHGEHYVLNGTKTFISNAPVADLALVFAVTDEEKGYHGGISAFLVERSTPGVSAGPKLEKMGLRSSPLGELVLEDVRVSKAALLGKPGAGSQIFTHSMNWERTCLFAAHVGTMQRLLEDAVEYARTRRQFDQPIGKFQGISHKLADMKIRLEAARLLVYKAAWRLERSREVALDAAVAKVFTSEALVQAGLATLQTFGGYGYMTEYEVERAVRDSLAGTLYSGTSEVQRNIIAGWLGL